MDASRYTEGDEPKPPILADLNDHKEVPLLEILYTAPSFEPKTMLPSIDTAAEDCTRLFVVYFHLKEPYVVKAYML
jgi:hypothetical protein